MKLDNQTIYKKTLSFSLRRFGWDFLAVIVFFALAGLGFWLASSVSNYGLLGLGIGLVLGAFVSWLILHFVAYEYKAGQIAMMTQGIVKDELPEDVIREGKAIVKQRFSTVAAYYAVTGAIKGVFQQIGRGITGVGEMVGGDAGGAVGSAISTAINTVVAYLCDCCLGWVFYCKDKGAFKATLEGAAIFFKHGKTLVKNLGRMFGMGLLSLLLIGGAFTGILYLIMMNFRDWFANVGAEIAASASDASELLTDPNMLMLVCALVIGVTLWSIVHSVFVRPFILVGVLRNFLTSGMGDTSNEEVFDELDKKSKKFKKLHAKVESGEVE